MRAAAASHARSHRSVVAIFFIILFGAAGASQRAVAADFIGTITPGGSPVTATTTSAGDNIRLTFAGTVGQRVSVKVSGVTIGTSTWNSMTVRILKPDGSTLGGSNNYTFAGTDRGFLDQQTLPVAGTHTVGADPNTTATGSATVTLYDAPADPAPLLTPTSGAGTAGTFVVTTPGQNISPTFVGTVGQRVSVKVSGVTIGTSTWNSMTVRILSPDGSTLGGSNNYTFAGTDGGFLDQQTLPVAGTYTVVLDPNTTATGSATVTLYDVPADPAPLLTPTSGAGTAGTFVVTTPGQNISPTFVGTVGQRVSVKRWG